MRLLTKKQQKLVLLYEILFKKTEKLYTIFISIILFLCMRHIFLYLPKFILRGKVRHI